MSEGRKNDKRQTYTKDTIKIFLELIWKNYPTGFLYIIIFLISVVLTGVAIPYLISQALADIMIGSNSFSHHMYWFIASAGIGVLFNYIGITGLLRVNARLNALATAHAFEHLLSRSIGFHADNSGGKLVSNVLEFGANAGKLVDTISTSLLPYLAVSLIGIIIVFNQSIAIGGALTIIYLSMFALTILDSKRRSELRSRRKIVQDKASANISDSILNINTIKSFANETTEIVNNNALQIKLLGLRIRDWSISASRGSIRMAILLALQVVFIYFLSQIIKQNPAMLGVGIYAFTYSLSMLNRLFDLGGLIRTIEESLLSASTMTKYLLEHPEIVDRPKAKPIKITDGHININHLEFCYPDQPEELVFQDLTLEIPAGQRIGLVGQSGGGKTSLVRLLMRFNDISSGSISIDEQDISQVTQTSLRKSIAYVPQEPLLFHKSIRENIAYANPQVNDSLIIKVAKLANAWQFISKLPHGLDTVVGERGVKLSGGQRQRIAIARAILKDAPILILDEATSALDSESEKLIQDSLEDLMKNRTSIVIAHRLSTIAKLDRIVVLDKGKVVEDGTHQELLDLNGAYAKLWKHQSGGFIDE